MESKMDHIDEKPKVKKKVFNILVECLQNLYHHVDKNDETIYVAQEDKSALLMIAKTSEAYIITTGN